MLRASLVMPAGSWHGRPADTVVLDHDERHRRRIAMSAVRGLTFLLDLAEATTLRNGDALVLDDGRLIEVVAAPEALTEIRCAAPHVLIRTAWHLGNRHLPVEIARTHLRIRQDHVIDDMLRGLGATLRHIEAPFAPEGGAYDETVSHGLDHRHEPHGAEHAHGRHTHAHR